MRLTQKMVNVFATIFCDLAVNDRLGFEKNDLEYQVATGALDQYIGKDEFFTEAQFARLWRAIRELAEQRGDLDIRGGKGHQIIFPVNRLQE